MPYPLILSVCSFAWFGFPREGLPGYLSWRRICSLAHGAIKLVQAPKRWGYRCSFRGEDQNSRKPPAHSVHERASISNNFSSLFSSFWSGFHLFLCPSWVLIQVPYRYSLFPIRSVFVSVSLSLCLSLSLCAVLWIKLSWEPSHWAVYIPASVF